MRTHSYLPDEAFPLTGRVPTEVAARIIGFRPDDMPVLASAKLLVPLGHPPKNGPKYYAVVILQKLASDPTWLAKASDAIVRFWADKKRARKTESDAYNDDDSDSPSSAAFQSRPSPRQPLLTK